MTHAETIAALVEAAKPGWKADLERAFSDAVVFGHGVTRDGYHITLPCYNGPSIVDALQKAKD